MIRAIWADFAGFKRVTLRPGFNVIVADRSADSSEKDTRNGLGKTSLVQIAHFLLGCSAASFTLGKKTPAGEWTFYGDILIRRQPWIIGRSPLRPSRILILDAPTGATYGLDFQRDGIARFVDVTDWTRFLGQVVFNDEVDSELYSPTFRTAISYFVRRGKDGFNSPFEVFRKQPIWNLQVHNAFLIGLDWRDASVFQRLRDQEDLIKSLKSAADLGLVSDFLGVRGELEADRARLDATITEAEQQLRSFEVPNQYKDVELEADKITTLINELSNANYASRQLLNDYREALTEQSESSYLNVEALYQEAGAVFEVAFLRKLSDVRQFHAELIRNRKSYLAGEITRLTGDVDGRERELSALNARRARLLRVLEINKVFEQFNSLDEGLRELRDRATVLRERLQKINEIENASAQLKIQREQAKQATIQHYNERQNARDAAVGLFSAASQALYDVTGDLLINITSEGFKFNFKILRQGSSGVSNAAIFCYDISLAELWASRSGLNLLWHDSSLFDPVEERQSARAIEYAATKSQAIGFQYLCLLNSDRIPRAEFSKSFDIDSHVILTLSDKSETDGLLGVRF